MKFISIFLSLFPFSVFAQQTTSINHAVIHATMTVIAPEEEDASRVPSPGEQGMGFSMRNFGDGETQITTYIMDSMVKTIMKSDMGRTTIIRNNAAKTTTTLIEVMGNKMGFVMTDAEQELMKQQMDRLIKARQEADTTHRFPPREKEERQPAEIVYTGISKRISGLDCKMAWVINTGFLGTKDSVAVWYAPSINLPNNQPASSGNSFGGFSRMSNFTSLNGLNQLQGLAIKYEMKMRRGRTLQMEVTKVDLKKELTEKDFSVPKDFDVKPYSEFSQMFRGMPGMRMMPRQ